LSDRFVDEGPKFCINGLVSAVDRDAEIPLPRQLFDGNPICIFKRRFERMLNTGIGMQGGFFIRWNERVLLHRLRVQIYDQKENRKQKY
jgi:hypothetical protein